MTEKQIPSGQAGDLRRRVKERARRDETKSKETLCPKKTQQKCHELRVHQTKLEMQNEELHRARKALEASRAAYIDLYEFAPIGYFTVNERGLNLEANLTAATL